MECGHYRTRAYRHSFNALSTDLCAHCRLWCVYELDVALDVQEQLRLEADPRAEGFVRVEFSKKAAVHFWQCVLEWAAKKAAEDGIDLETWTAEQVGDAECLYCHNCTCHNYIVLLP